MTAARDDEAGKGREGRWLEGMGEGPGGLAGERVRVLVVATATLERMFFWLRLKGGGAS